MSSEAAGRRRKLAAILMTDVSGFSAMMGRNEERTTELIQQFHRRVFATVEKYEGRVVDTAGDSVFGEFDSVVNAVRCAGEIQDEQAAANQGAPPDEQITTRIGVHLGDVIVEDNRVYGDGVNIAARLEQLAEPGGILVSEAVYQQVHNKLAVGFADLGAQQLKNIDHPIRLYSLGTPTAAETVITTRPAAPVPARTSPPRTEVAGPVMPVPDRGRPAPRSLQTWVDETARAGFLVPVVVGAVLLVSEMFGVPSGGVVPTGGAILLGVSLGHVWSRLTGRRGNRIIGTGLGIAAGALLTNWSPATNALFVLGGLATAASGIARNFSPTPERPSRKRRSERPARPGAKRRRRKRPRPRD